MDRQFGGTGLDLAISRQIAQLMGSTIELSSELGKAHAGCQHATRPPGSRRPGGPRPSCSRALWQRQHAHIQVLVVEVQPDRQEVAQQMLAQLGCRRSLAASAPKRQPL